MFGKRKQTPAPEPPGVDWSLVASVQREWPLDQAEAERHLAERRRGLELYEASDNYADMMRVARLLAPSLVYELHGKGILPLHELFETTNALLYSAVQAPPDNQTFTEDTQKHARLGLMICKKHRWQNSSHGGDGQLGPLLNANFALYAICIAPPGQVMGDFADFFQRNPVPADPVTQAPQSRAEPSSDLDLDAISKDVAAMVEAANGGDLAAEARLAGAAATMNGDRAAALTHYERAARYGDVTAMFEAGCASDDLGDTAAATYWWEAAAKQGHTESANNLAFAAHQAGDLATARHWFQRQGELGDARGFAALTQLATEAEDAEAEFRWAKAGAEGGQDFCQVRYASLLARHHPDDPQRLSEALDWARKSAAQGNVEALFAAGLISGQAGDRPTARRFLLEAEQAGHPDARRVIDKYSL